VLTNLLAEYFFKPFDINCQLEEAFPQFVAALPKAHVVIANIGAWYNLHSLEQSHVIDSFITSVENHTSPDCILIWRTTTTSSPSDRAARVRIASSHRKWHLLDANAIIIQGQEYAMSWDWVHPNSFFYEEIIRHALGFLTQVCDSI